jgi:hypothetical protein
MRNNCKINCLAYALPRQSIWRKIPLCHRKYNSCALCHKKYKIELYAKGCNFSCALRHFRHMQLDVVNGPLVGPTCQRGGENSPSSSTAAACRRLPMPPPLASPSLLPRRRQQQARGPAGGDERRRPRGGGVARGEGAVTVEVTARERRRWRQGGLLALTARDVPAHPLAASRPLPPPHHRRMGRRCRRLTAVGWVAASGSVGAVGTLRGRSWGIGSSGGSRDVARSPASVRATFPLVGTSSMFGCMAAVGSTSRITTSGDFGLFLDPDGRARLRPPPRRRSIPMPAPPPRTPPYSTSPTARSGLGVMSLAPGRPRPRTLCRRTTTT